MRNQKETNFAFESEAKESIADRLRQLIGNRTVRAASRDWGLSFSTLNNYLTRGTEPSLNVAIKIANVERVSIEWLATGTSPALGVVSEQSKDEEVLRNAWISAFDFMSTTESEALLRLMLKEGVSGIIKLTSKNQEIDDVFRSLSPELKQRALELINSYDKAKKGASEGGEVNTEFRPMTKEQKAS